MRRIPDGPETTCGRAYYCRSAASFQANRIAQKIMRLVSSRSKEAIARNRHRRAIRMVTVVRADGMSCLPQRLLDVIAERAGTRSASSFDDRGGRLNAAEGTGRSENFGRNLVHVGLQRGKTPGTVIIGHELG